MTAVVRANLRISRIEGNGPGLELLRMDPAPGVAPKPPLLLVHGAYTDAWVFSETLMPYFAALGHPVAAPSLRGHGESSGRGALDFWGLADYQHDVERALGELGGPAIVLGSSMGGLIAQRLMRTTPPPLALVLMGSVPPLGLSGPLMHIASHSPRHLADLLHLGWSGRPSGRFIELLVEHPLRAAEPGFYRRHVQRESSRSLWELTWAPMAPHGAATMPLLVVHGEQDRLVPVPSADAIIGRYGGTLMRLPGIGHLPMIERDWEPVAGLVAKWLSDHLPGHSDD
ncbi:MAG: alpha/beta fold hydrolase [Burkholderiaceae bacterium]